MGSTALRQVGVEDNTVLEGGAGHSIVCSDTGAGRHQLGGEGPDPDPGGDASSVAVGGGTSSELVAEPVKDLLLEHPIEL